MSNNLNLLGSASASNRENEIFKVFSYLNTKNDFSPFLIINKTSSKSLGTIINYLKTIQKAQYLGDEYLKYLNNDFSKHNAFSGSKGDEKKFVESLLKSWQNFANSIDSDWKENNKHLMQYVFGQNHYVDTKELFARLELSIVTYEFMKKIKKLQKHNKNPI